MPQIAHWVIGTVICSIIKMGHRDRSLLNCIFGQTGPKIPKCHTGSSGPIFAHAETAFSGIGRYVAQ